MFTKNSRNSSVRNKLNVNSVFHHALTCYYITKPQQHYILQLGKAQPGQQVTPAEEAALAHLFNLLKNTGLCINQDGVPLMVNRNTDDNHHRMAHFYSNGPAIQTTTTPALFSSDTIIQVQACHFEINLTNTIMPNDINKLTDLLEQCGLAKREAAYPTLINITPQPNTENLTHTSNRMR
jgi:hypothetical protein